MKTILLSVLAYFLLPLFSTAQNITYATVNKADVEQMNFEILGKLADNYLIYKENNGIHRISVYDYNLKTEKDIPITILPSRDKLLDISFFKNDNQFQLLYQYQEGEVVYLNAATVEANGSIVHAPVTLDTTMIAYRTKNKIYSIINCNDDSKLLAFKINKKNRSQFRFTTLLFDGSLQPIAKSHFTLPMESDGDFLTGYSLSNSGKFAFVKYHRESNGNIVEAALIEKAAGADSYQTHPLNIRDIYLDDIKTLADDANNRFLLASFYSTQKRGSIDGLYTYGINSNTGAEEFEKTTAFSDDLKKRARDNSNTKNAFNNFFINNITVEGDGNFSIASEVLYNDGDWDRWGYWGDPYWSGFGWGTPGLWGGWGWGWGWNRWGGWWPYSYYSPFFYRSYWWGGWGPGWGGAGWWGNNNQRFNAGNIAILSFDKEGDKRWDNVIVKSQSENNTDGSISYQVLPGMRNMYFLINNSGKISSLDAIAVSAQDGTVQKTPSIPAKEKRIDFMPKYSKQTGPSEVIIPYSYKRNISFAKVVL